MRAVTDAIEADQMSPYHYHQPCPQYLLLHHFPSSFLRVLYFCDNNTTNGFRSLTSKFQSGQNRPNFKFNLGPGVYTARTILDVRQLSPAAFYKGTNHATFHFLCNLSL